MMPPWLARAQEAALAVFMARMHAHDLIASVGESHAALACSGRVPRPKADAPMVPRRNATVIEYLKDPRNRFKRNIGDIEDQAGLADCLTKSDECERRGEYVLAVFTEVPIRFVGEVSAGVPVRMLRNEFEWWRSRGMARAASDTESSKDASGRFGYRLRTAGRIEAWRLARA